MTLTNGNRSVRPRLIVLEQRSRSTPNMHPHSSSQSGSSKGELTDNDTITKAEQQMQKCTLELERMAQDVADAKAIKEFNSDRLKRAFSVTVAEFLEAGDSGVAAEHKARASKAYGTSLHDLSEQYKAALRVIEQYEALRVKFDSARSILSCERAKLGLL